MNKKAVNYFNGKERYNCAQAIMKVYCSQCDDSDIYSFKKAGYGRAPGGMCGAVYAAGLLVEDTNKRVELEEKFSKAAGSILCREIRKSRTVSCRKCVALAEDMLKDYEA